jgi:hypothetical protein
MSWNFDINAAPRGKTVQVTKKKRVETDASVDTTFRTTYEHQRENVILATKCGKVIKTYWIPGESRWAGLANGEQPNAWMAWPTHPFAAASQGEAAAPEPKNVSLPADERSGDGANAGGEHALNGENCDQPENAGECVSRSPALITHKHIFLDDVGGGA